MSDVNPYRRLYEQHRDEAPRIYGINAVNNHCFPHFHSSIELVCMHSGCLSALLDGESYDVHAGQVLIVSGYMVHSFRTQKESAETILVIPLFLIPSLKKTLRDNVFSSPVCDTAGNETLGCPPGTFVNALRCQHAARAMLERDQTLLESSLGAGFECPRTFYRAFKQYYGMTPSQYARAHSDNLSQTTSKAVNTP